MTHDERFAEFQARRERERQAVVKVTWRKVSADTGGGWSGLGPGGALVFVEERYPRSGETKPRGYCYGRRNGKIKTILGDAPTLAKAKKAAGRLLGAS